MSRITFESKERSVDVRGSERFHAGYLTDKLTSIFLDVKSNRKLLIKAVPSGHHLHRLNTEDRDFEDLFETSLNYGSLNLELNGHPIDSFHLRLNTASAVGDDSVKLLARIHAQCEMHCFVEGPNRSWMADIIDNASVEVFRPDAGWDQVVELLRESNEGPVVMSYSVTESFLSTVGTEWVSEMFAKLDVDDEEAVNENGYTAWDQLEEDWYELDQDTKWDYASRWLAKNGSKRLEITPEAWPVTFGPLGITAGKLIEELQKL
jgi:hypothetical protein